MPPTEAADDGTGQQSHAGNGQQLQEALPREQVIQRRHLRQHDARLDTDEVVRQETYKSRLEVSYLHYECVQRNALPSMLIQT